MRAVDQLSIEEVSRWSHIDVPVNRQYVSAILFAHKPSGGTAAERIYYIRLWLSSRRSERERGLSVARALLFVPLSFPSRLYQWVLAIGPKQLLRNRPSGTQEIANKSKRNAPGNKEREKEKRIPSLRHCVQNALSQEHGAAPIVVTGQQRLTARNLRRLLLDGLRFSRKGWISLSLSV